MATVTKLKDVKEVEEISLALTEREARVLISILGCVCGCGPNGEASFRVYEALEKIYGASTVPKFDIKTHKFAGE